MRNDNQRNKGPNREVGNGGKSFAALMAVVWIVAGGYAVFRGISEGPWYMAATGLGSIIYGSLWVNVIRTGRHGRIPLWP